MDRSIVVMLASDRLLQVSFEVNIITPFSGVTLEIGGAVETYWKSLATPVPTPGARSTTPRPMQPGRPTGSAHASPANPFLTVSGGHSLTHSSVTGSYIYITVQVTRDLHPVVFAEWLLPETGYDVGVADVTLEQFEQLAIRSGRHIFPSEQTNFSPVQWHRSISRSMLSLASLLKVRAFIHLITSTPENLKSFADYPSKHGCLP